MQLAVARQARFGFVRGQLVSDENRKLIGAN